MDTTGAPPRVPGVTEEPISLLCVDDDPEYLALIETAFDEADDLDVLVETDPTTVPDELDGVDCVVSAYGLSDGDGLDVLETVRELAPDLPFVLHTSVPFEDVGEDLLSDERTDYLEKAWSEPQMTLLERRIRQLVSRVRLDTAARRSYAALETSREATLIVGPDGQITFANSRIVSEIPGDRSAIEGQHWTELFEEPSTERLRSAAIPAADDGWDWTGPTTLQTRTDDTDSCRTSLSRLADGSIVFVFHELDRTDETC